MREYISFDSHKHYTWAEREEVASDSWDVFAVCLLVDPSNANSLQKVHEEALLGLSAIFSTISSMRNSPWWNGVRGDRFAQLNLIL